MASFESHRLRFGIACSIVATLVVCCPPSHAAIFTWTGNASNNDWDEDGFLGAGPTNWTNNPQIPDGNDNVIFNSSTAGIIFVDLSGNRTVIDATLQGNNTIQIVSSRLTLTSGDLTVNGNSAPYTINSQIQLSSSAAWSINGSAADALIVNGNILGTQPLTKSGNGRLRLNAANTFSGPTVINGGSIRLSNGSALQNSPVTVNALGELAVLANSQIRSLAGSGDVTLSSSFRLTAGGNNASTLFSGDMSGTGGFTKAGAGTMTLTGNNTYSGSTIVDGTLRVGNGGTAGSIASNVTVNGTLSFDRSNDYLFDRSINGSGSLRQDGAGTLTLTSSVSLANGLNRVNDGVLQIGDGGTTGSFSGDILISSGSSLVFNRSNSLSYGGQTSGSGQLVKTGAGTLTLTGVNSHGGGTALDAGIISVDSDSYLGGAASDIIGAGGQLRVTGSNSTTRDFINNTGLGIEVTGGNFYNIAGTITGSFDKLGSGVLGINGDQTGGGTIQNNAGTLRVGNGATSGSIASDVNNLAEVIFDRSDSYTVASTISGTGNTTVQGGGTLSLTGEISNNGTTSVLASTLELATGGQLNGGELLLNNGTLAATETSSLNANVTLVGVGTFDVATGETFTLNGQFGPTGSLQKTGDGTLILNGTGTYTDGTQVSGGTLQAASTLALGTGPLNAGGGTVLVTDDANIGVAGLTGPVSVEIGPGGSVATDSGGSFEVTVGAFGEVTMTGGTITTERLKMSFGSELTGNGTVDAAMLASVGSKIATNGTTALGDGTKSNGFYSAGDFHVESGTTTLHDSNDAVFDSAALVTLGDGGSGSAIITAANGLTLDFGGNISGYGTINSNDDSTTPFINNGHIVGIDGTMKIELTGYVKGVGTLDNVMITGTDAPGFSPATVTRGSVEYDGLLQIEIEGSSIGEFDRIEHTLGDGIADLGGSLEVIANANVPLQVGDSLLFLTSIGGIVNTFDTVSLPSLDNGRALRLSYGETVVALEVYLQGDYNVDGIVNAADYTVWRDNLGSADFFSDGNGDGIVDQLDYDLWRANFGNTAAASALSADGAIPEPSTVILLLASCLMSVGIRRKIVTA